MARRSWIVVAVFAVAACGLWLVAADRATRESERSIAVGTRGYEIPALHSSARELAPYTSTEADERFLHEVRDLLASGARIQQDDARLRALFEETSFPKTFHTVALVIYARGSKRVVVVRKKSGMPGVARVLDRVRQHPRYGELDFGDVDRTRIQLDFIRSAPTPVDLERLELGVAGWNRFEPGVDGFRLRTADDTDYFLPGDAFVRSVQDARQLRRHLRRMSGTDDLSQVEATRFTSESYISFGSSWLRLYRGIPPVSPVTQAAVERAAADAIDQVVRTMRDDGRFLYYYDTAKDSFVDREHPDRDPERDPYYNILRHSGGGLLLLFEYARSRDPELLPAVRRAAGFLVSQIRRYALPDGRTAGYVFYNRKAKLGGSGIGLAFLAEYERLTGDRRYHQAADELKNHLLGEIGDTGEFRYYKVYLDEDVEWSDNQDYFGFYYPGEAVLALASFHNHLATQDEKPEIRSKLRKALRFLVEVRPVVHRDHYTSLPSDSWLMMGINEAWNAPELRDPRWARFVFEDADKMVAQTYTPEDALYADYPGAFYYAYGDYPYADGARAEGLLAALQLAEKIGESDRVRRYGNTARAVVWATLHLVNTPQALYFADRPDLARGGIRFKHTRQWFRIDTTQHVAGFYLKLLPSWSLVEPK